MRGAFSPHLYNLLPTGYSEVVPTIQNARVIASATYVNRVYITLRIALLCDTPEHLFIYVNALLIVSSVICALHLFSSVIVLSRSPQPLRKRIAIP